MAPQMCIVAVNFIEVIDHIDWLYNELNIYGGDLNHLSTYGLIFLTYPILLIYQCGNKQVVIVTPQNVQFGDVSFFKEDSDEERSCSFSMVKLVLNERWCRNVASLTVPGGQEYHFPHFSSNFHHFFFTFPQTFLIFVLILALRVGDSPTRGSPGYVTAMVFYWYA